jgi:predicted nucleic acid-binding protein
MTLIDTCILIEHYRGTNPAVSLFLQAHKGQMCISAVTDMEIAYGVRNKRELQQHQKLLETLNISILDIDEAISTTARHWIREYGLSHTLHLADALIATTAQRHNLTLLTFNLKDFRFLGISLDKI